MREPLTTTPVTSMPASLSSFIDAAADAIAREIATIRREALQERAARDAEHALRLGAVDTLRAALAERLSNLKDGVSVTLADVAPVIEGAVAAAVGALPVASPGRDADPAVIAEQVALAVAALPPAAPGKDADPYDVLTLIVEEVKTAVAALPAAKDGKSVALDDVLPAIVDEVSKAVAARTPELNAIPDDVAAAVANAVRLMAETPDIIRAPQTAVEQRVHVHMPAVIGSAIHIPAAKAPAVHVNVEQPPRRKTATVVTEHDAKGRIKRYEQEEVD